MSLKFQVHTCKQSTYLELPLVESDETASCSVTKAAGFTLTMSGSEGRGISAALAGAEEGGKEGGREGGPGSDVGLCASMEWAGLPDITGELI